MTSPTTKMEASMTLARQILVTYFNYTPHKVKWMPAHEVIATLCERVHAIAELVRDRPL